MQRFMRRGALAALLYLPGLLLAGSILASQARAETDQVRMVMPYGLVYLPAYIAIYRGLIEKHARAAGLGAVKVSLMHMTSGPASSDILLAGDADLAMGGAPGACWHRPARRRTSSRRCPRRR